MLGRILRNAGMFAALALASVGSAFAFYSSMGPGSADCGEIGDGYGPFDYRTAPMSERKLVEGAHFTPEIEKLIRGRSSGANLAGDIDYTLRAFPNHHRALLSMMNAGFKWKTDKPPGTRYTVQCWFERAIVFSPDDGRVYMLFGIYLLRKGSPETAVRALNKAQELSTEDANLDYNLGLAYFSLKDYDKSLRHAHEAYRLGFPLPGLRDMLKRAGKWQDPPTPAPDSKAPETAAVKDPASTDSAGSSPGAAVTK